MKSFQNYQSMWNHNKVHFLESYLCLVYALFKFHACWQFIMIFLDDTFATKFVSVKDPKKVAMSRNSLSLVLYVGYCSLLQARSAVLTILVMNAFFPVYMELFIGIIYKGPTYTRYVINERMADLLDIYR